MLVIYFSCEYLKTLAPVDVNVSQDPRLQHYVQWDERESSPCVSPMCSFSVCRTMRPKVVSFPVFKASHLCVYSILLIASAIYA